MFIAIASLLVITVLVVVVPNVMVVHGQRHKIKTVDELAASGESYDCIVVLGAAVRPDGTPSHMLEDRIRVGVELYHAGVAPKIIMSGDNSSDRETYDEVSNMKRFAIEELGVPSEDIFCDHAGLNTYDSMYRAYHVFGVKRMVVVTQRYHLYRSLYDASSFHIEAVGVSANLRTYAQQEFYDAREAAARISDCLKVLTRQNATMLSEPVDLHQSGDVTSW